MFGQLYMQVKAIAAEKAALELGDYTHEIL